MYGNQPWYASKTVWGGIVALLAGIAGIFGYAVDLDTQNEIAALAVAAIGSVGGLVSIYGRVKAEKKIGK